MARGGRRRVSIYTQRDRENKKFVKKVSKAILPNKRTQRAIAKELLFTISAPSDRASSKTNSGSRRPLFAREKTIYDLSKAQIVAVLIIGVLIFIYIFADCQNTFGSDNDIVSSFIIAAFFALLGGTFSGIFLYFFNLVVRKESDHIEPTIVDSNVSAALIENPDLEIAKINAPLFVNQIQDSVHIMQNTADPSTFFSRLDFAKEKLEDIAECKKLGIKFTGEPAFILEQFENEDVLAETINVLIDNSYKKQIKKITSLKTERGRSNSNQKWYSSFEPYFDRMPLRSKNYLDLKLAELQENY